ncbi:MAG: DUF2079 domain-containing protein, partial [Lentisphaerae bacterium]|nr:DUF2079 domain-containing protein [Lentisphaerota bacterium]
MKRMDRIAGAVGVLAAAAALALLLYGAYAAFSWKNFHFLDYGGYLNMLWNTGHGRPFTALVDQSYLKVHLSFTLALLGPFFRIWDHPFLPAVLQWAMAAGGALIVRRAAVRHGLGPGLAGALLFFFAAYPFTQGVMLAEFHGVALYFLLLPWLYYALSFRRPTVWLPLALLLGVREDAFLTALPILLYGAVRNRDKWAAAGAAAALLYGFLALFFIFPLINGVSIWAFRANWLPGAAGMGAPDAWAARGRALPWVMLPALFVLRRGWAPVLVFSAVPVLTALLSPSHYQYALRVHYPAAIMVCLVLGILEGARRLSRPAAVRGAAYLAALTLAAHLVRGFLPGGGAYDRVYGRVHPGGRAALRAA